MGYARFCQCTTSGQMFDLVVLEREEGGERDSIGDRQRQRDTDTGRVCERNRVRPGEAQSLLCFK